MGSHASHLLDERVTKLGSNEIHMISPNSTVSVALKMLKDTGVTSLAVATNINDAFAYSISHAELINLLIKTNFDSHAFLNTQIKDIVQDNDKCITVRPEVSIQSVVEALIKHKVKRIWIASKDGLLSGVSELDVLKFIYLHKSTLLQDKDLKIGQLDLGTINPTRVRDSMPVGDAIRSVISQKVHATAVVNDAGAFVAALTPFSFRNLSENHFIDFSLPLSKFQGEGKEASWVMNDCKLEQAVEMVLKKRIHRIWVINELQQPIRIISLSDLIRFFYYHNTTIEYRRLKKENREKKKEKLKSLV